MKTLLFTIYSLGALLSFSSNLQAQSQSDEAQSRLLLKKLQTLLIAKNLKDVGQLIHFPFYTAKSEMENGKELPADPISVSAYNTYKSAIFNADVIRILSKISKEQLSEIEGNNDPYFAALRKSTDQGSKLYEVYVQYPEKETLAESYFCFTFGKIKGQYRVIAYHSKWPLR